MRVTVGLVWAFQDTGPCEVVSVVIARDFGAQSNASGVDGVAVSRGASIVAPPVSGIPV